MSAHARLVRCCGCPGTPQTCIQATIYCPQYLSVSLPPVTLVRKTYTTYTSNPGLTTWKSSQVPGQNQGCFNPCPGPTPIDLREPNFGHGPFNTQVYDWQATYRANNITFRKVGHPNDPCGRYCIVRGSEQQGTVAFESVTQTAKLIYQQQCGGVMPFGMRVATAPYMETSLASRPMSEQNQFIGQLQSIDWLPGTCKWRLTLQINIWNHPLQWSGVSTPGDYCISAPGGVGGPAICNSYVYPDPLVEYTVDVVQEWVTGPPLTYHCPGTGQVVLSRFNTGGTFADLLNPANGTWDGNTCNGTGNQFSSSWSASCVNAYNGGVPLCGLRTSSGSPATVVVA